jgi:hypothetical protein
MSWMTKGGSSSASGRSPLPCPPNEFAPRGAVHTRHDAADATGCVCVVDGWRSLGATTKGAIISGDGKAVGKPLGEGGIYRFEGFG